MTPPGVLATRLARGAVVPAGRDTRWSRANVRHPAAAQLPTASPFALDRLPGITPRRPRSVAGRGRAFGACCFAGKLRSPAGPRRSSAMSRVSNPYAGPYAKPYASYPRTPRRLEAGSPLVMPSSGEVERPRGMVRLARLMHRRVRALGRPTAGAAFGGISCLTWLPLRVSDAGQAG
jgi:hypothetical protein